MQLPDSNKGLGDRMVDLLARIRIKTTRERLGFLLRRAAILVVLAAATAGVVIPGLIGSQYPTDEEILGTFASTNYKADQNYTVADQETTARLRQEAVAAIPPVFDLDSQLAGNTEENIRKAFVHLNSVALWEEGDHAPPGKADPQPADAEAGARSAARFAERLKKERPQFESLLQVPIDAAIYDTLIGGSLDEGVGPAIAQAVQEIMNAGVVLDQDLLIAEGLESVVIRRVPEDIIPERAAKVAGLVDLDAAREAVREAVQGELRDRTPALRRAAVEIAEAAIQPNLRLNRVETDRRRSARANSVQSVTIRVRRGEMILRDGDPFEPRHLVIFRGIQEMQQSRRLVVVGLGIGLVVLLLAFTIFAFFGRVLREVAVSEKDLIVLSLVLWTTVALTTGWASVVPALQDRLSGIHPDAFQCLAPVAFGPMLVGFLFPGEVALGFVVLVAALSGIVVETNSLSFSIYALVGGLVAATCVARARQRTTVMKAGLQAGLAHAFAGVFLMMVRGAELTGSDATNFALFGLISGCAAAVLVAGMVPVVEATFGYVSDIKLLELANLNHPLLRELIVQAPGTYHHSIIIGSLVEAGAEAIGANPLLARVMAYYHDVGKIKNPRYFAENQRDGNNPHDKLAPSMSALILKAHVKDGIELARAHRIPPVVADAIVEHHGNNLIAFFFNKAKDAESAQMQTVNEVDYRYAGRRPRGRETALVMIADVTEAASRSIAEPTSERLMGLIQKTVNRLFGDGALNESQLTLKDLHDVARAYHRVLLGIYHERPAYQTSATKERRSDTKETVKEKRGEEQIGDRERAVTKPGERQPKTKRSKGKDEPEEGRSRSSSEVKQVAQAKRKEQEGKSGETQREAGSPKGAAQDRTPRDEPTRDNLRRLGSDH